MTTFRASGRCSSLRCGRQSPRRRRAGAARRHRRRRRPPQPADNYTTTPRGGAIRSSACSAADRDQRGARSDPAARGHRGLVGRRDFSERRSGRTNGYVAMVMGPDNKTYIVRIRTTSCSMARSRRSPRRAWSSCRKSTTRCRSSSRRKFGRCCADSRKGSRLMRRYGIALTLTVLAAFVAGRTRPRWRPQRARA